MYEIKVLPYECAMEWFSSDIYQSIKTHNHNVYVRVYKLVGR